MTVFQITWTGGSEQRLLREVWPLRKTCTALDRGRKPPSRYGESHGQEHTMYIFSFRLLLLKAKLAGHKTVALKLFREHWQLLCPLLYDRDSRWLDQSATGTQGSAMGRAVLEPGQHLGWDLDMMVMYCHIKAWPVSKAYHVPQQSKKEEN